ncbi:MAG: pilus assembly protein [Chloroflexi bacterium]|nr:pilus assembly protein [Chloroflexota bacterium]
MATLRPTRDGARGQALLEFALVIPLFLVMLIGIIDLGRVIWANNAVANAAREAARYATVHGGAKSNPCPVGPPAEKTVIPAASSDCPYPSPSKDGIRTTATSFLVAGGTGYTVEVCYGTSCSGNTDISGATNARGEPVTVRVTSQVPIIISSLLGLDPFVISATSTMLVNH